MGCNKIIIDGIEKTITTRKDKYQIITIDNKIIYLHRYLAQLHIPNPNNYPVINHIDGNPSNNSINNLEWTTKRKNCEHARLNGLSEIKLQGIKDLTFEEYIEMRKLYKQGTTKTKLGELFNRHRRTIYDILEGKRYKDYQRKEEETYFL